MTKFTIITLYPNTIKPYLETSVLGRAQKQKLIKIEYVDLRNFGIGKHQQVDDTPYGGGPGMILRADVVVSAIKSATQLSRHLQGVTPPAGGRDSSEVKEVSGKRKQTIILLMSPGGVGYSQKIARELTKFSHIILVAGRFEGFDDRIKKYVDKVISIGPYILCGGEIPALAIVESVARLVPGVLGNPLSSVDESHSANDGEIEYPQYTKPEEFDALKIPDVLKNGNHQEIAKWRNSHRA